MYCSYRERSIDLCPRSARDFIDVHIPDPYDRVPLARGPVPYGVTGSAPDSDELTDGAGVESIGQIERDLAYFARTRGHGICVVKGSPGDGKKRLRSARGLPRGARQRCEGTPPQLAFSREKKVAALYDGVSDAKACIALERAARYRYNDLAETERVQVELAVLRRRGASTSRAHA